MREEKKGKKKKFHILREIKPEHYIKQTNSNTHTSAWGENTLYCNLTLHKETKSVYKSEHTD